MYIFLCVILVLAGNIVVWKGNFGGVIGELSIVETRNKLRQPPVSRIPCEKHLRMGNS